LTVGEHPPQRVIGRLTAAGGLTAESVGPVSSAVAGYGRLEITMTG
jgi:hypothetical protein